MLVYLYSFKLGLLLFKTAVDIRKQLLPNPFELLSKKSICIIFFDTVEHLITGLLGTEPRLENDLAG